MMIIVMMGGRRLGLRSRIGSKTLVLHVNGDNGSMDATTDLDSLGGQLEELTAIDPADAADLAGKLADGLAKALDEVEEGLEA
jgi:hypothetical protein